MLNCRKHSDSKARDDSFKPDERGAGGCFADGTERGREKLWRKLYPYRGEDSTFEIHCGGAVRGWKDTKDQGSKYQSLVTFSEDAGDGTLRSRRL